MIGNKKKLWSVTRPPSKLNKGYSQYKSKGSLTGHKNVMGTKIGFFFILEFSYKLKLSKGNIFLNNKNECDRVLMLNS